MLPHPSQPLKNKSKKYLFRHNGELTIIGKEDNYCETVNHNNAKAKYAPTLELDVLSWIIIITIIIIKNKNKKTRKFIAQLYTFHVGILGRHDGPHINIPQIILALEENK